MQRHSKNAAISHTPVAVLGTLAEFHREPIPYDLAALVTLVGQIRPDFLCLDMTPEQWQRREFSDLPAEYAEALLPLAHQTDIVVAPIAGERPPGEPAASGWRGQLIALARKWLASLQRSAPGPAAVNEGLRHFVADLLYGLIGLLAGRSVRSDVRRHTEHLVQAVLEVAQRDPGRRVLVAVSVQHCHHIRHALQKHPEISVVRYSAL